MSSQVSSLENDDTFCMETTVHILADGTVNYIFYDDIKPLVDIGPTVINRASHVDPEMSVEGVKWYADLHPVDGPKLGPFDTREEAIVAEVKWLDENYLNKQVG